MLGKARHSSRAERLHHSLAVEVDGGQMRVLTSTPGGPAARAGVQAGDVLVSVDGVAVAGMANSDVGRRMHGVPGSAVELGLLRHGKLRTLRIAREAVQNDTVLVQSASAGVAWIRISEFGGHTGAELATALGKLGGEEEPHGLVLDLRNDPGGMIPAAVSVAGAFLNPDAVVFSARGRGPGVNVSVTVNPRYYRAQDEPDVLATLPAWTRTVPLVVLVNGASASAAELVAGALQDNGRATVVGSQTFGKGSIQSVIPLGDDSGVKFTVARYFTPKGREIQAHGVTPDIVVRTPISTNGDLLLREADLAKHLDAQDSDTDSVPVPRAPVKNTSMFGGNKDKALQAAVALLAPARPSSSAVAGLISKWSVDFHRADATVVRAP